jgi:hypothetical protein
MLGVVLNVVLARDDSRRFEFLLSLSGRSAASIAASVVNTEARLQKL